MAIEFKDLPDIDDAEFQSYIKRPLSASEELKPVPQQNGDKVSDDGGPESTDKRKRPTYASFGDSGTTASVNGYGKIMRLSRYVGGENNPSKMLGLEFSQGNEPYLVELRAEEFQHELPSPFSGFGLHIMDIDSLQSEVPKLEFLNDRWPQLTYSVRGFNVRVRLFCQRGTVIQQFAATNTLASATDLPIILAVDFLMHDLNYMDLTYKIGYEGVEYEHGPHGHGIIALGRSTEKENEEGTSEQVGALVGLFRNGESEKLLLSGVEDHWDQTAVKLEYSLQEAETLELTAAFRLQYLKSSSVWKDFILPISDVDVSEIIQEPVLALDRWPFLRDDLSWHLRRNLEHVLSVCSIPLKRAVLERRQFGDNNASNVPIEQGKDDYRVTPIALTCGDFGDHRVSVPGSFFAFKYLLSMYKQLGNGLEEDRPAQSLRSRIRDTCKGHLQWVSELNHDEAFASNFWIDGKIVEKTGYTEIPSDSPENMPIHILKATEYLTEFKELKELVFVSEWLPSLVKSWIKCLIKTKNHLATTWRHFHDGPDIATYRLSDHVWIWRALQSVEQLITNVEAMNRSSSQASLDKLLRLRLYLYNKRDRGDGAGLRLEFTAEELRKQILRRFTIENDISKKRMLCVTRSARETRFLFHSRDTVLYYGIEWGFFRDDSQPVSELWKLLAQSQPLHDEGNDEAQWNNPLRYALAILMGAEDHQFDRNYSASEMASHAKRVLLDSTSENGLFPGQIDETTKEPALFDDELFRDFYFHSGFEIPYVLLQAELKRRRWVELKGDYQDGERQRLDIEGEIKASEQGKETKRSEATRQPKHQPRRRPSITQMSPILSMPDRFQSRFEPIESRDFRSLKRRIPYGKFVDLSNIVEMPEEWLYDYPSFLNFEPPKDESAATILKQADGIIAKCIEEKICQEDTGEVSIGDLLGESVIPMESFMIDVPKGKKQRKREVPEPSPISFKGLRYQVLWGTLQTKRTAKDAKKRLVYLGPGDCRVAALCYLASPEVERDHLSQFFDRHATVREFIIDDTTVASNSWETELHFTFYQLVKGQSTERNFSPVRAVESKMCSALEEGSLISEAAMGFRIVGDFFDRYWTCHIIENFSKREDDESITQDHWQQRKVLELILFGRISSRVRQSADDIIGAIEKGAAKKKDVGEKHPFGSLRFEDRSIESLQEILQILVVLKNNFASFLEIIDLWEHRESTLGQERPRWTRNDEQKYRRSIKRRSALQERCVRDLKNQEARIEFLITLVTSAQEAIRSARSLREAENIRLFTYVTVFFLPVGLSSSLFGMGQIPDRNVIVTMVITAVIALFITALVLFGTLNSKVAARIAKAWQHFQDKRSKKKSEPKLVAVRHRPSKETEGYQLPAEADLETGRRLSLA
ncbi:hypothetical protein MMC29_007336, partial [Sticta canariensis]|nr:hypothetical protein [Sticta canariensis]